VTFEQLDILRGYCLAAIILSIVTIGLSFSLIPGRTAGIRQYVRGGAGLIGGFACLAVFFLFSFITGWEEYFATKTVVQSAIDYRGRHQAAARVIRTLGEMDISLLGIVFGITGILLLVVAYINFRGFRKPY
jgi:hypothetical protein